MDRVQKLRWKSIEGLGSNIVLLGFLFWSAVLPFAQMQKIRFTGISVFVMVGGFLIFLFGKASLRRLPPRSGWIICTFILVAILPILDFFRWENEKAAMASLVLKLPMIAIPFIVIQISKFWSFSWQKLAFILLTISSFVNILVFSSQGLSFIFDSIRASTDAIVLKFPTSRPYYGFLLGAILFIFFRLNREKLRPYLFFPIAFFFAFEWLILGKLAILAFSICLLIYGVYYFRKNIKVLGILIFISVLALGLGAHKFLNSPIFHDLKLRGEINFTTLPKEYANSFNSRILLWNSTFELLSKNDNWLFGLGTQNFQNQLDAEVAKYSNEMSTHHFTPHNLFLAWWLQYGISGVFLLLLLFFLFFKEAWKQKSIALFLLSIYLIISVQTEVYLDREMGVQLLIWLLLVGFINHKENSPNVEIQTGILKSEA